jgi:hypothetical protein
VALQSTDADELTKFGYKQELDRSLGLFSSFAAGFSYISIMTGVFELFFFGFASGGPAFIWTWPAVFAGQILVALCFAELAGQYSAIARVHGRSKTPLIPSIVTGALTIALLVLNIGNQRVRSSSLPPSRSSCSTFPICTDCPDARKVAYSSHGRYFSLGRWGSASEPARRPLPDGRYR